MLALFLLSLQTLAMVRGPFAVWRSGGPVVFFPFRPCTFKYLSSDSCVPLRELNLLSRGASSPPVSSMEPLPAAVAIPRSVVPRWFCCPGSPFLRGPCFFFHKRSPPLHSTAPEQPPCPPTVCLSHSLFWPPPRSFGNGFPLVWRKWGPLFSFLPVGLRVYTHFLISLLRPDALPLYVYVAFGYSLPPRWSPGISQAHIHSSSCPRFITRLAWLSTTNFFAPVDSSSLRSLCGRKLTPTTRHLPCFTMFS